MNEQLEAFARKKLLEGLLKCSDSEQLIFKRMYSHKNLDNPISNVVAEMATDKLNWALSQVEATLKNKRKREREISKNAIDFLRIL